MTREGYKSASRKHMPMKVNSERRLIREGVNPFLARAFVINQMEENKLFGQREKEDKAKLSGALKTIKNRDSTPEDIKSAGDILLDMRHFEGIKNLLCIFANPNQPLESRLEALRSTVPLLIELYKYNETDSRREFNRAGRTFMYVINNKTSSEDSKRLQEEIKLAETQVTEAVKAHRDRFSIFCKPKEII